MGKTLFFGGTFNPPHLAHRMMLETADRIESVSKILVVPTNIPPHKVVNDFCAAPADRLEMCRLLCKGIVKAEVSDMEIRREGKSYSYDTLKILSEKFNDLWLLIGGDMLTSFDTWYNYKGILGIAGIMAIRRPGTDNAMFDRAAQTLSKIGRVKTVPGDMPNISSTEVRKELESGLYTGLLMPEISEFIVANGIYGVKK